MMELASPLQFGALLTDYISPHQLAYNSCTQW